jgi:hypothetical protein
MLRDRDDRDVALPGTLRFVMILGLCFLIGWFGLFLLMLERW